jgi:glycosyltransferase involved in cell wall biosynthesis
VGDIDEMSKNAIKILKDDAVLHQFKESAFQVAKKYDISTIMPLYEDLYNQAIALTKS